MKKYIMEELNNGGPMEEPFEPLNTTWLYEVWRHNEGGPFTV